MDLKNLAKKEKYVNTEETIKISEANTKRILQQKKLGKFNNLKDKA